MAESRTFRVTFKPAPRSGEPVFSVLVAASSPAEARRLAEPAARREAPRQRYLGTAAVAAGEASA